MITKHQQFDLFGKKTFEKAEAKPPFKFVYQMPNEACFFYIIQGGSAILAPSENVMLSTEEGVVMQCGNYLAEMFSGNESEYCVAIAIHLYPETLKMIYDKEFPDFLMQMEKVKPLVMEKHKSSELLKNYINSLEFYFENPSLISEELLKLKIKELLLLLARTSDGAVVRTLINSLFTPMEVDFKEVIEANLYNNLSVDELATLSNLSLSSFKRAFTKHYTISPAKYIRKRKLEKAAKLLKGTDLRISAICYDCGFADLAHFSKTFQKEYTLSPSEYRLT